MPIVDKQVYLAMLREKLDAYVSANTVRQIIADASETLSGFDVITLVCEVITMAKYIDQGRVGEILFHYSRMQSDEVKNVLLEVAKAVRETPAADVVERKRGKWLDGGLDGIGVMGIEYRWQKCSECGSEFSKAPGASYPNYCSMCGADMRGDAHG